MARLPRYAAPGMTQHVIQRGNNRSVIFASPDDFRLLHEFLRAACERYGCYVHAFVFMTNHVHLLITPTTASGISSVLQTVGRRYVQRFNAVYNQTGHLWEGRYKATVINSEQYLFACYRYIELNPVRAGIVGAPHEYYWSSYGANALARSSRRRSLMRRSLRFATPRTRAGHSAASGFARRSRRFSGVVPRPPSVGAGRVETMNFEPDPNCGQSERSAIIGSTRLARHAGKADATTPPATRSIATSVSTTGSAAEVSYIRSATNRAPTSAPAMPTTTLTTTMPTASATIIRTTSGCGAPRASRTPSSCVRRRTP